MNKAFGSKEIAPNKQCLGGIKFIAGAYPSFIPTSGEPFGTLTKSSVPISAPSQWSI